MGKRSKARPPGASTGKPASLPWSSVVAVAATAVVGAAVLALRLSNSESVLVKTPCMQSDYKPQVAGCTPAGQDACGRVTFDDVVSASEVDELTRIARHAMRLGGGSGGPTILDLASGALSYKDKFIDVWAAFNTSGQRAFRRQDLIVYKTITDRVRALVERTFAVRGLHLTSPCFFSQISGDKAPTTMNDEYWHRHIDTQQYGSFVYTALLYLTDYGADFDGGELHFLARGGAPAEAPVDSVRPRRGRVVLFTSGGEHPHRVTQVTRGTRLTLTIPFTCSEEAAIGDPIARALPDDS